MSDPVLDDTPLVDIEWIPQLESTGGWCSKYDLPSVLTIKMYAFVDSGGFGAPITAKHCAGCRDHDDTFHG